jgi:hypothetical protein
MNYQYLLPNPTIRRTAITDESQPRIVRDQNGNPLPIADFYYLVALDSEGNLASKGTVPADRIQRAIRLFTDEGWELTIEPILPDKP